MSLSAVGVTIVVFIVSTKCVFLSVFFSREVSPISGSADVPTSTRVSGLIVSWTRTRVKTGEIVGVEGRVGGVRGIFFAVRVSLGV